MSSNRFSHQELKRHRHLGSRGNMIEMHHSLRNLSLDKFTVLSIFLLPLLFDVALWFNLETIVNFWRDVFIFWGKHLGMDASNSVFYTEIYIPGREVLFMPFPNLPASLPSSFTVWTNLIVCFIVYLLSMLIPKTLLPVIYFLRALLLIQISASVYFLVSPDSFPYDMGDYISGTMALGIYLLLLIPLVMGMIYYIFDFGIIKKVLVTVAMMAYFMILLPFQYLMHAILISSWGIIFMPVLYLNFGLLLDTLMFIGWYSWAMTGKRRERRIA